MFREVKERDIILVPNLPERGKISIVEATKDWSEGYDFSIPAKYRDYGHIFPVKYLGSFSKSNQHVSGTLDRTFRTPLRFWDLDPYAENIEHILSTNEDDRTSHHSIGEKVKAAIDRALGSTFDENRFEKLLHAEFVQRIAAANWEYALQEVIQTLYPQYKVERVGGSSESEHGTDILVSIPSIDDARTHAIAIQIKDHVGESNNEALEQLEKSERHWYDSRGLTVIERIAVFTRSNREDNSDLEEKAQNSGIKTLYAKELRMLLARFGKKRSGIRES